MIKKEVLQAVSTMVGFIIGAGILAIPFVVAQAGFWTGMLMIVIIGLVMMAVNLYVGEVNLRTKLNHQLTGLSKIYLGKVGWGFMLFSMVLGMYGALTAYTIEQGNFLKTLLAPLIGGPQIVYSLIFFIIFGFIVYVGINWIKKSEVFMVFLIIIILGIVALFAAPHIGPGNLTGFSFSKLLIPFGVVLFAFLGTASIPEVRAELSRNRESIKKTIIIGSVIPIIIYAVFALLIVGVTGIATTESAMLGLKQFLGYKAVVFGLLFGVLTMATSFIAVGLALKEMYMFDFGLKSKKATALTLAVPLVAGFAIILLGINNAFYSVLNIAGALAGGVDIILIVLMHWASKEKSEREPEYTIPKSKILGIVIMIIAIAGMSYVILQTLGII